MEYTMPKAISRRLYSTVRNTVSFRSDSVHEFLEAMMEGAGFASDFLRDRGILAEAEVLLRMYNALVKAHGEVRRASRYVPRRRR